MSSATYHHHNHHHGRNTTNEDLQFTAYKVDSLPEKSIYSTQRPKYQHVDFKNDYEEVRTSGPRFSDQNFQVQEENVDKEAAEFIKVEHQKFQWSRTTSY